jgi:dipeptidyl aminopeptidase/acylaminoacyl peptidase
VTCPALILHGDRDAHVPVDHSELLAKVMRASGNEDVTLTILEDHNHLFLEDPKGSISGYATLLQDTNQMPDGVLTMITDWPNNRLSVDE